MTPSMVQLIWDRFGNSTLPAQPGRFAGTGSHDRRADWSLWEQFWFDLVRATRNLALVAKDTLGEQALNLKRLQPEIMATTLVDTLRFRFSA